MEQPHEHPVDGSQRLLQIGIGLTAVIFLLEFVGGLWTGSLALLSDAWHVFLDIGSLVLSFGAIFLAKRPVNDRRTFGLHRMEVLAAFINGLVVFLIGVAILAAAYHRWENPHPVQSKPLILFAAAGLTLNILVAALFYPHSRSDLNIHGAFLHVLGDALNTLIVLVAAFLMMVTGAPWIDPLVSALIAVVIVWGSGRVLKESLNTLLEGVPRGIQVPVVEQEIMKVDGVLSVHDLHVWSICSHLNTLSGHVTLQPDQMKKQEAVLEAIAHSLKSRFGITHTTIQVESKEWTLERSLA